MSEREPEKKNTKRSFVFFFSGSLFHSTLSLCLNFPNSKSSVKCLTAV